MGRKSLSAVLVIITLLCSGLASATSTDIPRILVVGDSWAAFVQIYRTLDYAMKDQPGMDGYGQRGQITSYFGIRASEVNTPEWLDAITSELLAYPTIDIVHLSLGGNDFILDSNWSPSMPPAQLDAFVNQVNANTEAVIDHILSIRPNIRIALCGYTYGNHPMGGGTVAQMNEVWVQFEQTRLNLCLSKPRLEYVHNLGLMQYYFGIPEASPAIEPHQVPFPGGAAQNYVPFPGGNSTYNAPLVSLADNDMHLTLVGYDYLTQNCVNEFYREWLSYPIVLEILPLSGSKAPVYEYRVRFSESVEGVDSSDFAVAGGASVTGVSGVGAEYVVTVDGNGQPAAPLLQVLDDDTIIDATSKPLGGPGTGNGGFSYDGPLRYADPQIQGDHDFDTCLQILDETFLSIAWQLGGASFRPETCDANGGSIQIVPPSISGNGMLDSYEFALMSWCLEDDTLDLSASGGVTHTMVESAWQANYARMLSDLGGADGRLAMTIPGLDTLLAGFMTLGDQGSSMIPVLLIAAVGSVIELPAGVTIPSPGNYTPLGQYLSGSGDADGDGYTNRQEYDFFVPLGGKDMYLAAALDPGMIPEVNCDNSAGGTYDEGDAFCLLVPEPLDLTGSFEWLKDGETLVSDGHVSGTQWRELHISHLLPSDSGNYQCIYDNGTRVFGPVNLEVTPTPVPVAGGLGLALLVLGLTTCGVRRFRG